MIYLQFSNTNVFCCCLSDTETLFWEKLISTQYIFIENLSKVSHSLINVATEKLTLAILLGLYRGTFIFICACITKFRLWTTLRFLQNGLSQLLLYWRGCFSPQGMNIWSPRQIVNMVSFSIVRDDKKEGDTEEIKGIVHPKFTNILLLFISSEMYMTSIFQMKKSN